MTSLVALSRDGRSVEVGIVGKEGMVGMSLMMGLRRGIFRAIMQMSGSGLRIRSEVFQDVMVRASTLRSELSRFALMHGMQVAQLAACNRLHEVDQRLVRWLLMCQDRVDSELLPLTHEFLAQMLGTGRPSVSLAAADLENAGVELRHRAGQPVDLVPIGNAAGDRGAVRRDVRRRARGRKPHRAGPDRLVDGVLGLK